MYAVDGPTKPCVVCGAPTRFVRKVFGPRGAFKGTERVCNPCGESRKQAAA